MRYDALNLIRAVAEFFQRRLDGLIDDLEHATASEKLVFDQRNVRFDPSGVAIHQEADRAGRREDGYLCVAISVALSNFRRVVPGACSLLFQMRELFRIR